MKKTTSTFRIPIRPILGLLLTGGGIALWIYSRNAHDHKPGHEHAHSETTALSLNNGKRWETDQPLRTGMQRIRAVASPVLATRPTEVTGDAAKGLSASIQENVTYLMENCKLEPKADAVLHVLITDLLRGAALIAKDPLSVEGATLVRDVLRQYPEYFDHPGWKPLPASQF